jgi:hypothetical protein
MPYQEGLDEHNRFWCDDCIPRGCSCNINPNTGIEDTDGQERLLPCCEYWYNDQGFEIDLRKSITMSMSIFLARLHNKLKPYLRMLKRPICMVLGHQHHTAEDWGGGYLMCRRCDFCYLMWKPVPNGKAIYTAPNEYIDGEFIDAEDRVMSNSAIIKGVVYHNIKVYDIDGDLIFTTSKKKADWYLDRNLAVIVQSNPLEIQLTFRNQGTGNKGDPFYLQDRENRCVVCGSYDNLTLHHCVPYSYRRHFSADLRDHSHHDVIPLCLECHDKYNLAESQLRKELSAEYDVPMEGIFVAGLNQSDRNHIVKHAYALQHYIDQIPLERQLVLKDKLRQLTGEDEPDVAYWSKYHEARRPIKTQGKMIVEKLTTDEAIQAFVVRWRKHFVETMQPKFLPEFWSINRCAKKGLQ